MYFPEQSPKARPKARNPRHYIEYFIDETWIEHLRRFDRLTATATDATLRERRLAFHTGDKPPVVARYLAEPLSRRDAEPTNGRIGGRLFEHNHCRKYRQDGTD